MGCSGERLGELWVEVSGSRAGAPPVVVFQPHPAFSHELFHDLMDQFGEYFPVCYLEFPGSKWNPSFQVRGGGTCWSRSWAASTCCGTS